MTPVKFNIRGFAAGNAVPVVKCLRMYVPCTCDRFAGGQLHVVGPSEGCAHPPE